MEGGLIKLIVVAVVLFLSYVSKGLEKKAQQQRRAGGAAPTPAPPRRKTGLEALAELEKKLREAQRAAEEQARARGAPAKPSPEAPPTAARPPRSTPSTPAAPPEAPTAHRTMSSGDELASRHLETRVSGLEARHLQDAVESRHLDLDVVKTREGHAAILDARPETDVAAEPVTPARRVAGAGVPLPRHLTELQRALIWTEVLGPPVSLRDVHGRQLEPHPRSQRPASDGPATR